MRYITAIWDEIVTWCHGGMEPIDYGLLYNWYAVTDIRNVCPTGWHIPTKVEFEVLSAYLGGAATSGGKLKEIGFVYWDAPNTGATNEVGFNRRGTGYRRYNDGVFTGMKVYGWLWLYGTDWYGDPNQSAFVPGTYSDVNITVMGTYKKTGCSLRPIKDSTILEDGETGIYIGNDGKLYPTICIGTQEWVAHNLVETKYRNGDPIPEVTDDAAWAALITGALCAYDNNWNNV